MSLPTKVRVCKSRQVPKMMSAIKIVSDKERAILLFGTKNNKDITNQSELKQLDGKSINIVTDGSGGPLFDKLAFVMKCGGFIVHYDNIPGLRVLSILVFSFLITLS
ncbi:hypothetical protein BJV82DRAFT_632305 [Fennellomyces sp. T-0311]|nr:hypothetical protein BJV82DRAFT_632305 [Fennellomyces sp. T-0311]